MSSRRKGSNPINRRSLNLNATQLVTETMKEEEESEEEEEQLTIPPDLFHDFIQLKTSTHLNTSQLMRKLLTEYNSHSMFGRREQVENLNTQNDHQTKCNKQVGSDLNYEIVAESDVSISSPPDDIMNMEEPLDLSVEKSLNGNQGASPAPTNSVQQQSQPSMHLPTVTMRNNNLPFIKTEPQELSIPVKIEPTILTPSSANEKTLINFNHQFLLNGIGSLIAVPFVASQQVLEANLNVAPLQVPVKMEIPTPMTSSVPAPAPRGRRPGRKPRGGGLVRPTKTAPGEMKIIAENTLFPGVYTSILKLPWSRRSRNKPPLTPHHPTITPKLQERVVGSSISIPSEVRSSLTAPTNPNNTLLLPASSQTIMSATTSQSVMMVYPNASISAVGKPVRRRGRPPKLPMLSHLLSEKKPKKLMPAETNMTNIEDLQLSIPAISESIPMTPSSEIHMPQHMPSIIKLEPPSPPCEPTAQVSITDSNTCISTVQSNGSIFQEMILSSKSLVNIRPRRRQSTEVKRGSDFMWTSFKIKPRGGKSTKTCERRKKQIDLISFEEDLDSSPNAMDMEEEENPNLFQELFHCKICNAILPADSKIAHQREHSPSMLTCTTCKNNFVSYVKNDCDLEKIQCDRCCKVKTSLNPSENIFISKFSCDLCDGRFKSFHAFNDHRHKVHGNEKITLDTHSCEECGKIFFTTKGLNHHMKTHIDKKRTQSVENGSKLFQTQDTEDDEEMCDADNNLEFICVFNDCQLKFDNKHQLVEHVQSTHSPSEGDNCPWPGCKKAFTSEKQLKIHILTHKDEKPMKCDFCEYRCRQRNALTWHMRKHPEAAFKYRKFSSALGND